MIKRILIKIPIFFQIAKNSLTMKRLFTSTQYFLFHKNVYQNLLYFIFRNIISLILSKKELLIPDYLIWERGSGEITAITHFNKHILKYVALML